MSCYYPLLGYRRQGDHGRLSFVKFKQQPTPSTPFPILSDYDSVVKSNFSDGFHDYYFVPCGQCIGCRLDYARRWADRLMLELPYHDEAYFITLTYDDEHVPVHEFVANVDQTTGEIIGDEPDVQQVLSLEPAHLRDFVKRLRRQQEYHYERRIRFFGIGEYGSRTMRPHYHAIVFSPHLPDLAPFGGSGDYTYYRSEILEKLWPFGYSSAAAVTWETCAYVARYMLKKQKGVGASFYDAFNLSPEFSRMSLKPAIGSQFYEDHKDEIYKYDEIYLSTVKKGITIRPPAFYDDRYDLEYPEHMATIKARRRLSAIRANELAFENFNGTFEELLKSKQDNKLAKIKSLKRRLEDNE